LVGNPAAFAELRESVSTLSSVVNSLRSDAAQTRLVSLNPELNINCALLVDRLVGLRADEQLQVEAPLPHELLPGARPRFAGPRMRDSEGRSWQQLHLDALSKHERFLQVVV